MLVTVLPVFRIAWLITFNVTIHMLAVDALGQEGFSSAPAWHEREYKRYYVPFTAEWHQ